MSRRNSTWEVVRLLQERSVSTQGRPLIAESDADLPGFEHAQMLELKAFEHFECCTGADTQLDDVLRSCVTQNVPSGQVDFVKV